MLADREWCRLRSVSVIGSDDALLSIRQSVDAVGQADEQAAALARLAGCGKIVGNGEFADLCERIAQQRWKEFSEIQARIFELIQSSKGVKKLERIFPI
jgi:hypothetical protein